MPLPEAQSPPLNPPRRRGPWKLVTGLVIGLVAMCGMCGGLLKLFTRGQARDRAQLEAFVIEHRAVLDELVALARQEKANVSASAGGAGVAADRYGPFLERLGAPGPLTVIAEPFEVRVYLYVMGRDADVLVFAPHRTGPFDDDLDEARARGGGIGSAAMQVGGGWIVERSWD